MNVHDEFLAMLDEAVTETGVELAAGRDELAAYMAERSLHLSTISAEPGFGEAVRREAANVAMRAGLQASDLARGVDQRLFGMIGGALRIAAIALA